MWPWRRVQSSIEQSPGLSLVHTLTVLPRSAGALVSLILDFNYQHRHRVDLHQRVKSQ